MDDGVHVHRFVDMHNIGDALVAHQFTIPVMDVDYLTITHKDLAGALQDLKQQGGGSAATARHRGLTGKGRFEAFERFSRAFRNEEGLIESTCEIIYGHALGAGADTGRGWQRRSGGAVGKGEDENT